MNITWKNKPSYSEEGQPNPIRWAILAGDPASGFTNETSWMKCKDFFNDYCYTYNTGKPVSIYGFNTGSIAIAPKGESLFVAVKDVTKTFISNVTNCTDVQVYQGDFIVLEIAPKYLTSTYNISLISLIIRLCNTEELFLNFDDLKAYKGFPQKDQQKWDQVVKKGIFFSLPEKLQKYIWYAGPEHNSDCVLEGYQLATLVHNNGVLSYGRFM